MSDEKLTPERAVRLLRAKVGELEHRVLDRVGVAGRADDDPRVNMASTSIADIALVAQLLADHIERSERNDEQLRQMYGRLADRYRIDYGPQFGEEEAE